MTVAQQSEPRVSREAALLPRGRDVSAGVRAGTLSAARLLDGVLSTLPERDATTAAFLATDADEARRRADEVDALVAGGRDAGPLAGVPIAVKDNICTRGVPTTCASRILDGWRPPYDAAVVERVINAGGILLGKTNLDEFGMGSSTETSAFGPTRNPLDVTRVPGGSSGGSAAAVAAGYVPLALGSDTGGSVRQPAALCGVVGVKPTYGRISRYGLVAYASSLDTVGVLADDVADAALFFDVIAGHDDRDSTSLIDTAVAVQPYLDRGVEGIRVGLVSELLAAVIEPAVREQVLAAAEALQHMGAEVTQISLPTAVTSLPAYYLIASAEASSNLARYDGVRYGLRVEGHDVESMQAKTRAAGFGAEVKRRIMLGTYALSAGYYDAYYRTSQRVRTLVLRDFDTAFQQVDVLLGPVTPTTAFGFGERADPYTMYQFDVCTVAVNLAGVPALSVPFGTGANGMPVGIQVIGGLLAEPLCFQVAAALEARAPS